jgi:hypothetical protein
MQTIKELLQGSDFSFTAIRFDTGDLNTLGTRIRATVEDLRKEGYIITAINTFTDFVHIKVSRPANCILKDDTFIIPEAALDGKESFELPNTFIWNTDFVFDTECIDVDEKQPRMTVVVKEMG